MVVFVRFGLRVHAGFVGSMRENEVLVESSEATKEELRLSKASTRGELHVGTSQKPCVPRIQVSMVPETLTLDLHKIPPFENSAPVVGLKNRSLINEID